MRKMLDYWVVYGGFDVLEGFVGEGLLETLIPVYWVVKVGIMGSILLAGRTTTSVNVLGEHRDMRGNKPKHLVSLILGSF